MVNFDKRTRAYGDSLAPTYPQYVEGLAALDYWLNTQFPEPSQPFKAIKILPCEQQADGISCGIAACATISSQLGLNVPWSAEAGTLSRYTWAFWLIQIHQATSTHGYTSIHSQEVTAQVLDTNNVPQLQAEVVSDKTLKGCTNRMDIASILCADTPEKVKQPPLTVTEHTQEHLDSRAEEPIDFVPYNLPSPLSTNNQGYEDNHIVDVVSGDYVDCNGVLHFLDTDDKFTPGSGAQPPEIPYATNNYGKHPRSSSASESLDANTPKRRAISKVDASNQKSLAWHRHLSVDRQSGPTRISKTAVADCKRIDAVKAGKFMATPQQITGLLQRAREMDPAVTLDPEDTTGRYLIHSLCGTSICDRPLRTSKLKKHHENCKSNSGLRKNGKFTSAAKGSLRIDTLFKKIDKSSNATSSSTLKLPDHATTPPLPPTLLSPRLVLCRGLWTTHDKRIQAILDHSQHGGTTSIHVIAEAEYGKPFKSLTDVQKEHVRTGSVATAEWRVYLDPLPHIQSSKCRTKCNPKKSSLLPLDVCLKCAKLFTTQSFQCAMARKPVEDPKNFRFVPFTSRNKNQGIVYARYFGLEEIFTQADSKLITLLMQFAHLVLQGKINETSTFFGVMQAIVAKEDQLARGKGMQNMRYNPGYIDFCSIAHSMGSQAYRFLKDSNLLVLGERDIRKRCSKAPGLPIGVCEQTCERAANFINILCYTGPVSICCNNTKLLAKWIPHYDGASQKWLVLGGVGDPIQVDGSVEDVHDLLVKATEGKEKASKLRVWCLQAAAPKVPVLVLAALPISSSIKANKLFTVHSRLIEGLLDAEICVASYACNGSATERKVTQLFLESASKQEQYSIPHPEPGFLPHKVSLYFYGP
ncbi:hypothetical protein FRC12_016664, partial [Ceratobasidium sp. 428]